MVFSIVLTNEMVMEPGHFVSIEFDRVTRFPVSEESPGSQGVVGELVEDCLTVVVTSVSALLANLSVGW